MIIGQEKLISTLNNYDLSTLPRTIMLEGSKGSGRHLISKYIADKFNLPIEDISDDLSYEKIESITLTSNPCIYIIDASKLTVKNENVILKFLEEPLKNAFIILLSENKYNQIDTIRNRCYIMSLAKYSKDLLKSFITIPEKENIILTICSTPGDIITLQSYPIQEMLDLCIKIFEKLELASFANSLTLSNNIAFKNEKDKYDFDIFFRSLLYISKIRMLKNEKNSIDEYLLTSDYYNRTFIPHIDKKALFDNYLIALKKMKGQA